MSEMSQSVHSVNFSRYLPDTPTVLTTKNTYDDWQLIPSEKPNIKMPEVKTAYVELPGVDGNIDLSETLAGRVLYGMRSGNLTFYVDGWSTRANWYTLTSEIANFLHGQQVRLVLEDDPNWYFIGRVSIDEIQTSEYYNRIVLAYNLRPYKYSVSDSTVTSL